MNEHKNTILAIVLSLIVVVGWEYFFARPEMQQQQQAQQQQQQQTQPSETGGAQPAKPAGSTPQMPSAPSAQPPTQTREAVIAASPHVDIDTPTLRGSIDLKGARIDNLALEQYRDTTDPNSPPIVLLSPSGAPDAYYAEFGWVPASGTNEPVPGPDTVWKQDGSGALGIDHPVTLSYDNGQGLIFTRTISVDDHYLFSIKDQVQNKGGKPVSLYPYALISRHGTPQVLGYYILHEGPIGVMGDQGLQEENYKKIADKKSETWDVTDAWLGFTDKYWAAVLLPDTDAKVNARFSAADVAGEETYQTDYLAAAADHRAGRQRQRRFAAVRRRQGSLRRRHRFPVRARRL